MICLGLDLRTIVGLLGLSLALGVGVACDDDDDGTTSASSSSGGSSSGAGSSGGGESGGGGSFVPVDPVACGDATCDAGMICREPGLICDRSGPTPMFASPPPVCEAVPPACTDVADLDAFRNCLSGNLCDNPTGGPGYEGGTLSCPPVALDCF